MDEIVITVGAGLLEPNWREFARLVRRSKLDLRTPGQTVGNHYSCERGPSGIAIAGSGRTTRRPSIKCARQLSGPTWHSSGRLARFARRRRSPPAVRRTGEGIKLAWVAANSILRIS